jgi:hypothetical protein
MVKVASYAGVPIEGIIIWCVGCGNPAGTNSMIGIAYTFWEGLLALDYVLQLFLV